MKNFLIDGVLLTIPKTASFIIILLSLFLFSCSKKETLRRTGVEAYEGPVTVEILRGSFGFGKVGSIKSLAKVVISKHRDREGSFNGFFGYEAPGKMRINLFGPFGLTMTEILITEALIQLYVPPKNILYEWHSPEITFTGLMNNGVSYEIAEEDDMYVLHAYKKSEQNSDVAVRYYFDREFLLNRSMFFYKDGTEFLKAEFDDFNGRIPERTKVSFANGLLMDISLEESEFESDIPDEYFKSIEHGDKQIKPFREVFKRFAPMR